MTTRLRPRAFPLAVLFAVVCLSAASHAQVPSPSPTPLVPPTNPSLAILTLDEVLRLANTQASTFQTAVLNERIAGEDVTQARAAFMPKVSAPLSYLYNTPAIGLPAGEPRGPSFITSDAIGAYEAVVNVSGDFDVAGKLRATLAK